MFDSMPLGIGQYHLFHELFKANPRLAIIVLALIVVWHLLESTPIKKSWLFGQLFLICLFCFWCLIVFVFTDNQLAILHVGAQVLNVQMIQIVVGNLVANLLFNDPP